MPLAAHRSPSWATLCSSRLAHVYAFDGRRALLRIVQLRNSCRRDLGSAAPRTGQLRKPDTKPAGDNDANPARNWSDLVVPNENANSPSQPSNMSQADEPKDRARDSKTNSS